MWDKRKLGAVAGSQESQWFCPLVPIYHPPAGYNQIYVLFQPANNTTRQYMYSKYTYENIVFYDDSSNYTVDYVFV